MTTEPAHCPVSGHVTTLSQTRDAEPFEYFEGLFGREPVTWDDESHAWLVASHELNREIARQDDRLWQMPFAPGLVQTPLGMSEDEWLAFMHFDNDRSIMHGDTERHRLHRQWIVNLFSTARMKQWRTDFMLDTVHRQIDRFVDRGSVELCTEFADRVASQVFHQVLGLPTDDEFVERIDGYEHGRFAVKQRIIDHEPDPEVLALGWRATNDMIALVEPYVMERRSGDGDDFISLLWREGDEVFGPGWGPKNVIGETLNAWSGGTGTTRFSTANALYLLLAKPELQDEMRRGGQDVIRRFIEESLRLYGPLSYRPRWAKQDLVLAGQQIRKGDKVIAVSLAGSRDPGHYSCPADVELDRPSPRDHFSFWQGPHTCPGAGLAREELVAILEVLLDRVADLRLDPAAPAPRFRFEILRRWEPLHATFTRSAA